jgi:PPK2 family polyphosphate:nucleotide phosphotransferase
VIDSFLVPPGTRVKLKNYDTAFTADIDGEQEGADRVREICSEVAELQDMLLANETYALLGMFQGMDGAAKDGTIKAVMSCLDPQGCHAWNFKKPAGREMLVDYLRRFSPKLPERGRIGIFNRSWYEEVINPVVDPSVLDDEQLPDKVSKQKNLIKQRYEQINNHERYLAENGIVVVKFFLNLSHEKQRERLLERLEVPEKKWKFDPTDLEDREKWDAYQKAYEDAISATSTEHGPWYIIPADHRWFSAVGVAEVLLSTLRSLKLSYPEADPKQVREAKKALK